MDGTNTVRRWLLLLSGLVCFGVGIALMVRAQLGLSPWEVLHQGISQRTGIPIGTVSIVMGVPIMLAWLPLGQKPGWGTLLNIVMVGSVTNTVLGVMPDVESIALQLVCMTSGVLIIGFGSGLYLSSNMGAGPRDGLMLGLAKRTRRNISQVRTLIELAVLVFGLLLGGTVGLGTIVFAFGIGPVVQATMAILQKRQRTDTHPAYLV